MSLDNMTVKKLRELAAKHKISGRSGMRKAALIAALRPFEQDISVKKPPKTPEKTPAHAKKPLEETKEPKVIPVDQRFLLQEENQNLPFSYDRDVLELLPKNPEQMYAYWDLSTGLWQDVADAESLVVGLEMQGYGLIQETGVSITTRDFYFHIPDNRGPYRVVLSCRKGGGLRVLMSSAYVKALPNHPGKGEIRFVKIPFELSLREMKNLGGPMPPAPSEMPDSGFFTPDSDNTPYTRRFQ